MSLELHDSPTSEARNCHKYSRFTWSIWLDWDESHLQDWLEHSCRCGRWIQQLWANERGSNFATFIYFDCLGSNQYTGIQWVSGTQNPGPVQSVPLLWLPSWKEDPIDQAEKALKSGFSDSQIYYNEVATTFLMFLALEWPSWTTPKNSPASEGLNSTTNQQASA